MRQASKVDTGIVVGYREVKISNDGTVRAVTGGVLGAQHAADDTTGWQYVVREPKGDLVSVTQREPQPIPIGQRVLVIIEGRQARVVPDYATSYDAPPEPKAQARRDRSIAPAASAAAASPIVIAPAAGPGAAIRAAPAGASPASTAFPPAARANAAPISLSPTQGRTPNGQPASANAAPGSPSPAVQAAPLP